MPVNRQYYYQDQDVKSLSYSTDPRIIWAPAVPMDQIGILEDSFKGLKEGERLLLPLQADGHWTGAMVTKDDIGLRITWLDSMHPEQQISDDKLVAFEQALGITLIPKANEDIVLKRQRDATSCGPWMIKNLSAAGAVSLANEADKVAIRERYDRTTEEHIRQTHIDELGEVFAKKQLHNNVLENIDPVKLQAFEGSEEEKKAMRDLALVIQRTSREFQAALDNITEISQVLPEETQASLRQIREAFVEQRGIIDQIDIKVNEPGYLVSLNENVKLLEHSAEHSRTSSRASSVGGSIGVILDPADLGVNFTEQGKLIEGQVLNKEGNQDLLTSLVDEVVRDPVVDVDAIKQSVQKGVLSPDQDLRNLIAKELMDSAELTAKEKLADTHGQQIDKELKEEIIANTAKTITISLFGKNYTSNRGRVADENTIKEIVASAVNGKTSADFEITPKEEGAISGYIKDNLTKKTLFGRITGGIQLKTLSKENKEEIAKVFKKIIVKEELVKDSGSFIPNETPPKLITKERGRGL